MTTGWETVSGTEWSRLFHAYGAAHDTPAHLRALTSGDSQAQRAALDHLWSAVIHQGTPWSVTPPAALVVAGMLGDPALSYPLAPSADPGAAETTAEPPLRAALLHFLAAVAEAGWPGTTDDELAALAFPAGGEAEVATTLEGILAGAEEAWESASVDVIMYRVVVGIREVAPALAEATAGWLADEDPQVRVGAAYATSALVALPGLADRRDAFVRELAATARQATGRDERAALVLAMGDLGAAPHDFLPDPDPAVRACAALAPALAEDPAATGEILAALADPTAADRWFRHRPPKFTGHVRFTLLHAALARDVSFSELLPAAVAVAATASPYTADADWGALLAAAFPDPGDPPAPPSGLTQAQRTYLAALVANDALWDTRIGNASFAFHRVGLPYDRDACRRLATAD